MNPKTSASYTFALTGNPNSGKTSIFNEITGASQKTGNWGGVTVDVKTGSIRRNGNKLYFTDIPGTYSLSAYTMEEVVARDYIINGNTDVIINVVDSTNLERNLYLAVQLLELGKPVVFAFNMYDELRRSGSKVDTDQLGKLLGTPIVYTIGRTGHGIEELISTAITTAQGHGANRHNIAIHYGKELEEAIEELSRDLERIDFDPRGINLRWYALKLLEEDELVEKELAPLQGAEALLHTRDRHLQRIQELYQEDAATLISEKRYGFILGALGETLKRSPADRLDISEKIDNVMTHRLLAYPIFAAFMWLLFQATFSLGAYPMEWIETGVDALGGLVRANMAPGALRSLLADGIIGGVGGVVVFLPNILILFFGISLLEDTGYMARIAFIMDKLMHRIGLHGKSFIPLIMGIGCNVPAIMAARTLESNKDRILTILIAPLITCSARLPVYILFAGTFFPHSAGNIIFVLYFFSFFFAFFIGFLFKKTLFRGEEYPFVMELPPYRIPTFRSSMIHMWEKAKHYLQKMGGVVLIFSIIIWVLSNYPQQSGLEAEHGRQLDELRGSVGLDVEIDSPEYQRKLHELEAVQHREMMSGTYIGQAGRAIQPALAPLGFDWRMGVSLLTGFVAKEVVVSTLGVLYTVGDEAGEESEALRSALRQAYTPLTGLAFLFFVMLYTPCIVAFVTVVRELASWRWSLFSLFYQIGLAWLVAFLVRWGGILLGYS
ncbi:MAG TPA: ferrous iron transport protein B [Sediminispirochaeta sp.]|nr:ferrous iron transport protein B [Sediminispirochaeta sp.]